MSLPFERMIDRGLADSRSGRVISNEEMAHLVNDNLSKKLV